MATRVLNGPSNMLRIGPWVAFHLRKNLSLGLDYDFFWRESLEDGIYGLGVKLLRSGLDNRNRYVGSQPSAGAHWQPSPHIGVAAAYTHFSVGPFLTHSAQPGKDVDYAAIWATYKFSRATWAARAPERQKSSSVSQCTLELFRNRKDGISISAALGVLEIC